MQFLLTHPVWDVTDGCGTSYRVSIISTHTSRVGCDGEAKDFNDLVDISTHTSRVGCDGYYPWCHQRYNISTHTSRVGCDQIFP